MKQGLAGGEKIKNRIPLKRIVTLVKRSNPPFNTIGQSSVQGFTGDQKITPQIISWISGIEGGEISLVLKQKQLRLVSSCHDSGNSVTDFIMKIF